MRTWNDRAEKVSAGLLACSVAVLTCTACSAGAPDPSASTGSPGASAPSPVEPSPTTSMNGQPTAESAREAAASAATDAVIAYYRTTDELLTDPETDIDRAATVAGGAELEEVRRLVQQQRLQDQHQKGAVFIVFTAPTSLTAGPPRTVDVDACLDVSGVDTLYTDGESVTAADRAPRSLVHVVVVDRGGSGWLVESTDSRGEPCPGT